VVSHLGNRHQATISLSFLHAQTINFLGGGIFPSPEEKKATMTKSKTNMEEKKRREKCGLGRAREEHTDTKESIQEAIDTLLWR
jgi:hypothetical protein